MKSIRFIAIALFMAVLAQPAKADTNIFVVLDGSNSMWGQIEGTAKIETALGTLYEAVEDFPEGAKTGLIAYGHREEKNCQDVETLLPLSNLDKSAFIKSTENFTPKGKTPIAESLAYTAAQFKQHDANNNIVLISDGIETCGDDPCGTIKRLRNEEGLNVDVHVIGFDVDADAEAQLKCIAEAGNGKYITATSNQGLEDAFTEVAETVKVREQEFIAKQKPNIVKDVDVSNVIFEDTFESELSSEDWQVYNELPMMFGVADGKLTIAGDNSLQNIVALNRPLPDGDWQARITFTTDNVATFKEAVKLGFYQDDKTYLFGQTYLNERSGSSAYDAPEVNISFAGKSGTKDIKSESVPVLKMSCILNSYLKEHNNEPPGFVKDAKGNCDSGEEFLEEYFHNNYAEMVLRKEGSTLRLRTRFEYDYAQDWAETTFPIMKPFGQIAITFNSNRSESSTIHINDFRLETIDVSETEEVEEESDADSE